VDKQELSGMHAAKAESLAGPGHAGLAAREVKFKFRCRHRKTLLLAGYLFEKYSSAVKIQEKAQKT
jgi:hypothetical protein